MPRPRSSRRRKAFSGTLRADRLRGGSGVPPLSRLPSAPRELSEQARAAWVRCGRLALRLGTLSAYDLPLLELTARTLGSVAELEALLRTEGLIVQSGEVRKAHPAAALLERSRAQAHRLLADLGLTPPARERISIEPAKSKDNRFTRSADPAEGYFT